MVVSLTEKLPPPLVTIPLFFLFCSPESIIILYLYYIKAVSPFPSTAHHPHDLQRSVKCQTAQRRIGLSLSFACLGIFAIPVFLVSRISYSSLRIPFFHACTVPVCCPCCYLDIQFPGPNAPMTTVHFGCHHRERTADESFRGQFHVDGNGPG